MIVGFDVGGTNARGVLIDPSTGQEVIRNRDSSAGSGPKLVQTLVDNAGLSPEQAECAVAGIEATGSTPAELLDDPAQLTTLLGQVIPECTTLE